MNYQSLRFIHLSVAAGLEAETENRFVERERERERERESERWLKLVGNLLIRE